MTNQISLFDGEELTNTDWREKIKKRRGNEMRKYRIFDLRAGLMSADVIIEAKSPLNAVQKLYNNVTRTYDGSGDIVVSSNNGSYVYNGNRNNIKVIQYENNGVIYTELKSEDSK